ncbi:twin-arginine translocation pathway signal sequence domain-containing protein [Caballeronia hypogeia]|uniref:Twin-arginine translocation pathway signal sequence domain-containing protein n=1 Tax=Caballeronia hypogeia TaxID=1777140 RepID=A0A158C587_9BURK|nr:DUF1501 domain-containing protein [Caballeronia hypogeia]SAK77524.1 twin-arginine translocation pathway signal sequence domain-containing protein [Caballeronia hypogeia]
MNRREFLSIAGAFAGCTSDIGEAFASVPPSLPSMYTLVLVDLDGGNDALNTVVPIADARYRTLRPRLALSRDRVLPLDARTALHPSLSPLMSTWRAGELAIVQGVGYEAPNRSHYRSRQIWDTASHADEYRVDDWLAHVRDVNAGSFVASCDAAARFIAARDLAQRMDVIRLTLHGFDTHEYQAARHAALLAQLAQGLASLRARSIASGAWGRTLVMTRSEFGRSARENDAGGTEHGAAAAHFVMGGNVRGGLFGAPPRLDQMDAQGGLPVEVDFRRLYATVLDACSQRDAISIRGERLEPLPILRALV